MLIAYCYASGQIEFGRRVPDGAIQIARGPAAALRELIYGTARLAYDNKTWLVPGIPEAPDQKEAGDALGRYMDWIRFRAGHGVSVGCMRAAA
jgi:hypothetical protein